MANKDALSVDFTTTKTIRVGLRRLNHYRDPISAAALRAAQCGKIDSIRHGLATGRYGERRFYTTKLHQTVAEEIVRGTVSIITRGVIKMTEETVRAAEILDESVALFERHHQAFSTVTDATIADTKKRVSQLNDYTNRLATALQNLNKTLGDEKMVRALQNAETLVRALEALQTLESNGSLANIMRAISPASTGGR